MSTIVVIDDDAGIREMLSVALSTHGHHVLQASNGQEGLKTAQQALPDLIFLDLMMPGMDGYQVLDTMQADPNLSRISVIILTALNDQNQIIRGLQKGAKDYITKPFGLDELLARANVQLRTLELERKIQQSEVYHRALFERSANPDLLLDATGTVIQANSATTALLNLSSGRIVGTRLHEFIEAEDRPEFEVAFSGALEGSEIPIFEVHLTLSEGRRLPVDVDLSAVDIEDRRHILLHLRDIRRRKTAETRTTMIFEYIGDGVFITDHRGTILQASRSAAEISGFPHDEIVGLDISRFHSREQASSRENSGQQPEDRPLVYEDLLPHANGQLIPVEWTRAAFKVGDETFFIGVVRNLTDRKAADDRRLETDRLRTLLEIAGGAAHEINQPLTAILGYAEMAMDMLPKDEEAYEHQRRIAEAAIRISQILKQMQGVRNYRTRPYANGHKIVDFRPKQHGKDKEATDDPEGSGASL